MSRHPHRRGGGVPGDDVENSLRELLQDLEDEHLGDEEPAPTSRREARLREQSRQKSDKRQRRKSHHRSRALVITLISLVAVAGLVGGGLVFLQGPINSLIAAAQPDNYDGDGSGDASIVVNQGDTGSDIAAKLEDAGVVKSASSFYKYLVSLGQQPTFQPGSYSLRSQMSNSAALAALQDSANRSSRTVTIPEGYTVDQIFQRLETVGFDSADLTALRSDPQQFGIPAGATDLEGFLFPTTYTFDESASAKDAIQIMVNQTLKSLDALGVSADDRLRVVILASIVQKEAGSTADMPKVARVFLNRLSIGMDLQSDATVAYGANSTGTVWTTTEQRADASNKFNTYLFSGLPPGAISNPGQDALSAAVNPAAGDWLYFVVVNLQTGQTTFSATADEHAAAVAQLQQWCEVAANASYCS